MKEEKIEKKESEEVVVSKGKHTFWKVFIFIFLLVIILLYCYARVWIHKYIFIQEYALVDEKLPSNFNGFKLAHFADIHYGKTTNVSELKKVVDNINMTNSDIVVFSGDLFDNGINLSDDSIEELKSNLSRIQAKLKKFAVIGDNDYEKKELYLNVMTSAGFIVLDNSSDLVFNGSSTPIQIAGFSSLQKQDYDVKKGLETTNKDVGYRILIAHEPEIVNQIDEENIDLVLCGHSLGGLISIPFGGGIFHKSYTSDYLNGYYEVNGVKLYVSSGIGTENLNFRFLNPPSINFYRFYNYQ